MTVRTTAGVTMTSAAAAADRYAALVREADAALEQLAACRRLADSATAAAAAEQPATAAARRAAQHTVSANSPNAAAGGAPLGGAVAAGYTQQHSPRFAGSRARGLVTLPGGLAQHSPPLSAGATSPLKPRSLSTGGFSPGKVLGSNPAACKQNSSRQLAAAGLSRPYGSNYGYGSYQSPQKLPRPGSAGALGTAAAAAAMAPCSLRGELQALDSDIAAAEASLQAAAQRLGGGGAAGGFLHGQW